MPVETMHEPVSSDAPRVDILGVRVRPLSLAQTVDAVESCILNGERRYGVFINVYNVIEARHNAEYRQALNDADFPMPDGIPLVWASRVLRDPVPERVCGPDFYVAMNRRAEEKGYSVYIMCGGDRKAERTAEALQKMHPRIKVVGAWTPPWGRSAKRTTNIFSENCRAPSRTFCGSVWERRCKSAGCGHES